MQETVCKCNHWHEEHHQGGECDAPGCECETFEYDPAANTPEAIAWRGGDPARWPQHVKGAVPDWQDWVIQS